VGVVDVVVVGVERAGGDEAGEPDSHSDRDHLVGRITGCFS
jgi:hypothetical protein